MKTCNKCKETKPINSFEIRLSNKDGRRGKCRDCRNFERRKHRQENLQKYRDYEKEKYARIKKDPVLYAKKKEAKKAWNETNKGHRRRYQQEYRAKNPDRSLSWARHDVAKLADSYIKSLLTKGNDLRPTEIPQLLIELKRQQLLIKRELEKTA